MQEKKQLLGFYLQELEAYMEALGEKPYRAKQLFQLLHKGMRFDDMLSLSKTLRERLKQECIDMPLSLETKLVSGIDGTEKYLFRLLDGNCVEGVLMQYKHGTTLCLSTQVGCRMGCKFCASTLGGKVRNLSAAEMLAQVLFVNSQGHKIGNIVLMGIGEPLDNYDEVLRFLRLVNDKLGLQLSLRHVSLSSCGLVDKMYALAKEGLPVTLALSLHAPNDAIRKQIMPIASRYSVEETIAACRYWVKETGRRIIFEYALIEGVNAERAQARELASLLRNLQCHVNLIPLNPVKERNLLGVTREKANAFLKELEKQNISATIRREMGRDINGACGQLRRQHIEKGNGEEME